MKCEIINSVEITQSGELLLILEGGGKASYQYVYREVSGVYWDNKKGGFHSNKAPISWSYSDWFTHIVTIVKSIGIELELSPIATWKNISEHAKSEIVNNVHDR